MTEEEEGETLVTVSEFDHSVENYFKTIDTIATLCEEETSKVEDASQDPEFQRISSSITFLQEWKSFAYKPRDLRFCREISRSPGKEVVDGLNLPQFSSATVPKEQQSASATSPELSKDFMLYVGGPVWALDWCPIVDRKHGSQYKHEVSVVINLSSSKTELETARAMCNHHSFIAVSAHPPGASYHQMGVPLTGRGAIQIWCLLNVDMNEENSCQVDVYSQEKNPRGRPRKKPRMELSPDSHSAQSTIGTSLIVTEEGELKSTKPRGRPKKYPEKESTEPKKPRGRPRKTPMEETNQPKKLLDRPRKMVIVESDNNECVEALAIQLREEPSSLTANEFEKVTHIKESTQSKKSRGRTRKMSKAEGSDNSNHYGECIQVPLAIELPKEPSSPTLSEFLKAKSSRTKNRRKKSQKKLLAESHCDLDGNQEPKRATTVAFPDLVTEVSLINQVINNKSTKLTKLKERRKKKPLGDPVNGVDCNEEPSQALVIHPPDYSCQSSTFNEFGDGESYLRKNSEGILEKDIRAQSLNCGPSGKGLTGYEIPKDIHLPRMVLCLAHNGRVAWDMKWRPVVRGSKSKHRMGYLAVLLGNGALEVWEIPLPSMVKDFYASSHTEGSDPRFLKLRPIFRCSKLICNGTKCIPLTVEWSASFPHDLLLAGCHDGTVALWKFCANDASKDTKPLLCFSADAVPIRALAWAPVMDDPESANVIVTAGHEGLKFWDIRDPYRPLWDLSSLLKVVYSVDWFPDPRCILLSLEDGVRILSLAECLYDVPVTGKPFTGSKYKGLHTYYSSPFAIWSVHASRLTGMVAYCSADGAAVQFQLTATAVSRNRSSTRATHFLLASITEEESVLTVNTPLPNTPTMSKKSSSALKDFPSLRALHDSNQGDSSHVKAQIETTNDKPLALCYGNDPGDLALDTTSDNRRIKSKSKSRSNKDRSKQNLAMVNISEEGDGIEEGEGGKAENNVEVMPSPMVAMHRVRWNMNEGSERWLCYGGAAGVVRCQEIGRRNLKRDFQKKWTR